MMAISRFTKSTLLLLTLELLNPLGGFVEETFCLLLDVHDFLVDVAQTSSPQRADLLLQLDVLLLRVVETLEGKKPMRLFTASAKLQREKKRPPALPMLTCCSEDATCVALAACIVASFAMRRLSSVLFLRASTSAERSTSRVIASICLFSSRVSRSSTCGAKASGREGRIWRKLLRGGLASKGLPEPWHPWCRSGWPGPRSEPPPPS